jgi:hypothetical protein
MACSVRSLVDTGLPFGFAVTWDSSTLRFFMVAGLAFAHRFWFWFCRGFLPRVYWICGLPRAAAGCCQTVLLLFAFAATLSPAYHSRLPAGWFAVWFIWFVHYAPPSCHTVCSDGRCSPYRHLPFCGLSTGHCERLTLLCGSFRTLLVRCSPLCGVARQPL